jgi:exodeoxyribonuclease X
VKDIDQISLGFEKKGTGKFLYFDTETTDILNKDIVQLAFITDDGKSFNMYFKPASEISYKAMSIHNITPEMVEKEPTFDEAQYEGESLKKYLEKLAQQYVWVAHNVEFDVAVLEKVGVKIPNCICTFKIARDLLSVDQKDEYDLESYSLQFLRYYLKLYKNEDKTQITAHDALCDVHFLRDLFHYFLENFDLTTEKMLNITKAPLIMRSIQRGKYAGMSIKEIHKEDPGYLEWVVDNWEDKPEVIWNIKRILGD